MRRVGRKGEGRFEAISWDEALRFAADRLKPIAARAPEAIVPYSYAGTMGLVQGESIAARFFNALGASRLDRTICAAAGAAGLRYTYGASLGMHTEYFEESELILIWGANPIASNLHFWTRAQEAKRRGARLIAIDPYRSLTAEKCHQHIALKPGTDARARARHDRRADTRRPDRPRVHRRPHARLRATRRRAPHEYPPARAAQICGIEEQVIVDLARAFGATKKASIRLNYGMQRVRGGGNAVRAIACLPSLTGAWRERSGGLSAVVVGMGAGRFERARTARPAARLAVEAAAHRST